MRLITMRLIKINHPSHDEPVFVSEADYIRAKTKDLREFGFPDVTETQVELQLERILHGGDLNIIGKFMEKDIVVGSVNG